MFPSISYLILATLAYSTPITNLNGVIISHPPFSGVNPDGGLGRDQGGRTRREPGHPVYSSIDDDILPTARVEEERSDMVELLERYAPVFKLSIKEEYFPSTVEFMLSHYDHVVNPLGLNVPVNTSLITPNEVDKLPNQGSRLALSISEPHDPQPNLESDASEFLRGTQPTFESSKRGQVEEDVYGIWVDRGRGIVDLHYWTYYPFNFGKHVPLNLGWLGHHVSDWERLRVRTVNGTATAVDYNVHAGPGSVGTIRWQDVPKIDDRPVAYVAAGSHGVWSTPGHHVYADLFNVFKLVDETDDKGPIWDTKNHVVPIQWWHGPKNGSRVQHDGNLRWMNYRGRWGNLGDRGWMNSLLPACHVVDAPIGPNRDFRGAMDCAVGEASVNQTSSTYSFLLRTEMAQYARSMGVTEIKVEQICERSQHNEGEEEDVDDDDDGEGYGEQDGGARYLVWAFSTHKTEARVAFNGTEKHTLSVPACKSRKNAISSYKLTFCTRRTCLIPSHERPICTHNPSKAGYTPTKAVVLDDLDEWSWDPVGPWQKMRQEAMGMANRFFVWTWVTLLAVV